MVQHKDGNVRELDPPETFAVVYYDTRTPANEGNAAMYLMQVSRFLRTRVGTIMTWIAFPLRQPFEEVHG